MDITLSPALSDDDRQAVRNMFVAYFYDLAPYDPNLVINAFGLPCWEPALTQGSPGPRTAAECASTRTRPSPKSPTFTRPERPTQTTLDAFEKKVRAKVAEAYRAALSLNDAPTAMVPESGSTPSRFRMRKSPR